MWFEVCSGGGGWTMWRCWGNTAFLLLLLLLVDLWLDVAEVWFVL